MATATGARTTLRWIQKDMNPSDGPSRGEGAGGAEVAKTKTELEKATPGGDYPLARLFEDKATR